MSKARRFMGPRSWMGASAAVLAVSLAAVPAHAQESAQEPASENEPASEPAVEDIVVTAQFREQNLQQTPLAITAISGDMLEARGQTSIADVAGQAPSVTLKAQGAAFGPSLVASIRGVGQFDFNPALEPGVGVYVDDVYYATLTGSIFDLLDLDRVEVLRGPQGTLAGRNSIGGAIRLYSSRPTGSGNGSISATYGSDNRIDLRGSMDIAMADDLFLRVAGVSKSQNGYIDRIDYGCAFPASGVPSLAGTAGDCIIDRNGEVNYDAGRVQLRYAPSSGFEINLAADYTRDRHNTPGGVLTFANYAGPGDVNPFAVNVPYDSRFMPPYGSFYNYANFYNPADGPSAQYVADDITDFEGWGVSGSVAVDLSSRLKLTSITAYRAYALYFTNDDDYSPLALSLAISDLDFWSFSQEVRLSGSLGTGDRLEYTLGGYYSEQKSVYLTTQDIRYAGIPAFTGNDPVTADTLAAFAHVAWQATDRLTLTGGLRYTEESKDYTFGRTMPDGSPHPVLGALDGLTGRYSGNRVDYRANVQYRWSPTVMTYAQVSTGFKGGGVNPRPFSAAQLQPFNPETLTSYEAGIKTDLLDRRLRLNLAAFHSRYSNIQLQLNSCPQFGGPGPCAMIANAGSADVNGIELEAALRPVSGLMIDGSISYLDFEYTDVNPQAGGVGGVQLGFVPPYVPEWKWSIGIQYEIPLGDAGSLTPRFDAAYQSRVFSSAVNAGTNRIPGYTLANASLTWRTADEDWAVAFEVSNLFDQYYYTTSFDQSAIGGAASAQPGRPRQWALTVRRQF
ncbi:TonB-dependent receptor [Sphingomonas canadensis]|uniref:TonB-dependent receptor n=1 Tax=Sphingomonas canadensis TaxID=1219257 RepID=A0ABW3H1P6_9SPHN|nr:TonB-dependent receptor [Sphingomonas canadensis]MCW3834719.1 TonB-dependent receptor [Sphingomonas canadensis]